MEVHLRRIPLSHRSHVIGFQALAMGVDEHESALERDFVTLADFRVDWSDGRCEIVEIKYRTDARWLEPLSACLRRCPVVGAEQRRAFPYRDRARHSRPAA
jgi:hypothetical protein